MNIMTWRQSPDDLWNLANLPPKTLRYIYCDTTYWGRDALSWESIRQRRKNNKKLLGPYMGTKRETYQDPDSERERVRSVRQTAPKVGGAALKLATIQVPEEHLPYHEKLQEVLEGGVPEKLVMREGSHQGFIKNSDNEIEYTDEMPNKRVEYTVRFDVDPQWPPVTRVESVILRKQEKASTSTSKRAVILPDLQIPHQDDKAIEVALKVLKDAKPDKVIVLGDLLDLEAFSKFHNLPTYAASTQEAIVKAHQLLVQIRKLAPSAEIIVLEGNHDKRLQTHVAKNAMAAFGLRRADQPEGWPVLSVPYLCAFDTLDIEYVSGYPANRHWINQNLQVRHGHKVRSSGSTAKVVSDDERVSTIFGHVHRLETQFKTHHTYDGGKTNAAYGIGCLCLIDGSVPSVNRGVDLQGKPVTNYENWTQAFAVVDYEEGDGPFHVQPLYINTFKDYMTMYNGKKYLVSNG